MFSSCIVVFQEEERRKSVVEAEAAAAEPEIPPFQQLFVSCPDGLHVSYMQEPTGGREPFSIV